MSTQWLLLVVALRSTKMSNTSPSQGIFRRTTGALRAVQQPLRFPERRRAELHVTRDFIGLEGVPGTSERLANVPRRLFGLSSLTSSTPRFQQQARSLVGALLEFQPRRQSSTPASSSRDDPSLLDEVEE